MIFEQIATGGCQSYLIGCAETCAAALIDPEIRQIDRYHGLARATACGFTTSSTRIRMQIISRPRARSPGSSSVPVVMHRDSPAPFADLRLDDGDMLVDRQHAAAGDPHAGSHARLDVPCSRGSRVHRRHAADRRHRAHRPADRRSRGALRKPVQRAPQARPRAQGIPGARLQAEGLEHDRAGARDQPAAAEARPRGVRRDDAAT